MEKFQICQPSVSAVIPAYNAALYIAETIQSLLQQKFLTEIIVVDDHSSDKTCDIVEYLRDISDGRIQYYQQMQNHGVSASRNFGVQKAKNDLILFMDADDIAEPDLVELELNRLMELQNQWVEPIVLSYSAYSQISSTGEPIAGIQRSQQVSPEEILGYEFVRNQISTSGVLVARKAFLEVGGFDENLKYSEDWDLWLRLAQIGGFAYVDEALVRVRRHSCNLSGNIQNMLDGEKKVLNRYSIHFIEKAIMRRHLPWEVNQTDLVSILYRIGQWQKGYQIVQEVIRIHPEFANGYFLIGLYYLAQREWANAQKAFDQTLAISPDNGAALNNLAALLALKGETQLAAELFMKVLMIYPNYLDARHNLDILTTTGCLDLVDIRFTWRQLRYVLTSYWR